MIWPISNSMTEYTPVNHCISVPVKETNKSPTRITKARLAIYVHDNGHQAPVGLESYH